MRQPSASGPSLPASLDRLATRMVRWPRPNKRALLVINDLVVMSLAVWLAMSLRHGVLYVPPNMQTAGLLLAAPVIGIAVFVWLGLYRLVTRFIGSRGNMRMAGSMAIAAIMWAVFIFLSGSVYQGNVIPRLVPVIYWLLAFTGVIVARMAAAWMLGGAALAAAATAGPERRKVVIWGAGLAGAQLLDAMRRGTDYEPVGFIDTTESLWGQDVGGLKIYRPAKLAKLIERDDVREVLLALPEKQRRARQEIIRELAAYPVRVKLLPAVEDIAAGRVAVTDLRPLDVDDLLGRDPVPPDPVLLARDIRGRNVLVTGAGGSIGSELVRQILRQNPRRLVLLDISEAALYQVGIEITEQVERLAAGEASRQVPVIVSVLGSVRDETVLARTIRANAIETIYHAAAYKHVPIVEHNPVVGIANNTFGTAVLAETAQRLGVERVVLISTDKAVRPTNVMGASKRLAELIFQAAAADPANTGTVFTMVRFGNVLDSSGSVVRRFRTQIEAGGPVTVTHREVVRYFMSIPEAATLVIQAGAMARGGEVFVLDMGEPVKIAELARSMIRLMGLEVQDEASPSGDIAIRYVGLRPGEKLYEELWHDDDITATEHPRIMRKAEAARTRDTLQRDLEALAAALDAASIEAIHAVLLRAVEGYTPDKSLASATLAVPEPAAVSRVLH